MSTPPSKKPSPKSSQSVYTYAGLDQSGRIRLTRDDQILVIHGAAYASSTPPVGQTKVALVQVNATPGYQYDPQHKKYRARTNTGETFQIIGIVEKTITSPPPVERSDLRPIVRQPAAAPDSQVNPTASSAKPLVPESDQPSPLPKLAAPPSSSFDAKKQAKLTRLQKEFQRVTAQRSSGIDPTVRIAFAAYYLGESESNLYRRRADGQFPNSIQRGKGTFWLMSDLDAFKAGTWKPPL